MVVKSRRNADLERGTSVKGWFRCGKTACKGRRMFIISFSNFSQSEKRKRERERGREGKKGEHTHTHTCITHRVLSYDYRRATRNPFSCFLQTEHAFTLAVTWNRLQIPVFLCIFAGHYSANNCRCESKRFHCRRFSLVVPPRPMQNCTLFNSLTRDKGVSRCSQSSGSMNAKDSKIQGDACW